MMLQTQKFLIDNGLQDLISEYKINIVQHPTDSRIILNYDQIKSVHKNHPIVVECRGLVLDSRDWSLVARSFPRFFNFGEYPEMHNEFVWEGSSALSKEDGSLCLIYYWQGRWHVNTRGSFGNGKFASNQFSARELVDIAYPDWQHDLSPTEGITYVCELCSQYNKIVRAYSKPTLYLLTTFQGEVEDALYPKYIGGFRTPEAYHFANMSEVASKIENMAAVDATWEGIVLRDRNGMRIKCKSDSYVALHHLFNNGAAANPKNLVTVILKGETEELLSYFPEMSDIVRKCERKMFKWKKKIDNFYYVHHDEPSQKKFAAVAIKELGSFSSVAFTARKLRVGVDVVWRESGDLIYKVLFNGN